MPGSATDLYDAALELLEACVDALDDAPGGGVPYAAVWPGLPAYDAVPALYVHAGGSSIGDTVPLQPPLQPMQRIVTTGIVELVQFTITILRAIPIIETGPQSIVLPSAAEIGVSAQVIYGDLWAIWNHLKNAHRAGTLFQSPSGRREFMFEPALPVRDSGGAGGWEIPVRVQLSGYSP